MIFKRLAEYFSQLEQTTLRNKMTEILASLFKEATTSEIGKLCYLLQGRVAPLFTAIEFGMADKMVIRAIGVGLDVKTEEVTKIFKKTGDLGKTVEKVKSEKSKVKNIPPQRDPASGGTSQKLKISDVYDVLYHIATSAGARSQEKKINLLGTLLKEVDPLSACFVVKITLSKLRLGFSNMTMLDSLSWLLKGSKELRAEIEKAYNVRPDLGFIAEIVKSKGVTGLCHIQPKPGTPILMARANRLTSPKEILEKIGNCAIEYKYDGLRLQIHKDGKHLKMFSRNLEDVTAMFPDIAEAVLKQIETKEVIFEGEVVAYNPKTGVFVPFQETMQRKRKYDIAQKAMEIPVKLFTFELLFLNGNSYLEEPYKQRKKALKIIIKRGKTIEYANEVITDNEQVIEDVFEDSVQKHFEGIIAKRLDGVYEAGMRGWNWIKYKKAMNKKLADTVDVLVLGYSLGEGKRTIFGVGQFLTGIYDEKKDLYKTVTKIGTGLTDEQFREFKKRVKVLQAKEKPPLYDVDKLLEPDIWLAPSLVVEIGCDEITRSAVHTAGRVMMPSKSGKAWVVKASGYALRFPKLIRFRDDKRPEEVTTVAEIKKMYKQQGKK